MPPSTLLFPKAAPIVELAVAFIEFEFSTNSFLRTAFCSVVNLPPKRAIATSARRSGAVLPQNSSADTHSFTSITLPLGKVLVVTTSTS